MFYRQADVIQKGYTNKGRIIKNEDDEILTLKNDVLNRWRFSMLAEFG